MTSLLLGLRSHQIVPAGPVAWQDFLIPFSAWHVPVPLPAHPTSTHPSRAERHISLDFTNILFSHSLAQLWVHSTVSDDEGDSREWPKGSWQVWLMSVLDYECKSL